MSRSSISKDDGETGVPDLSVLPKVKRKEKKSMIPYRRLYRYARLTDWFLMVLGTTCSVVNGLTWPIMLYFFGNITTIFTLYGRYQNCNLNYRICFDSNFTTINETQWNLTVQPSLDSFESESFKQVYGFVIVACVSFVMSSIQVGTWNLSAVRQVKMIRMTYFRAMLRQDIGFHDLTTSGELNTRLSSDIKLIKKGIGEKVSFLCQYLTLGTGSLILAFVFSWKLALVATAIAPFFILPTMILFKVNGIFKRKELSAYSKAGTIVAEAISSIKTVVAFGGQAKEVDRYSQNLQDAKKVGIIRNAVTGLCLGGYGLAIQSMMGLTLWYGVVLVTEGEIDPGAMITAIFNVLMAGYGFGAIGSYLEAFPEAQAAGAKIFEISDRIPDIDIFSNDGEEPNPEKGEIVFDDVKFSYASRPDVHIFRGITFTIKHGERVALVGQSGCGKSTIIQLIQRFYDVKKGQIIIGGSDVKRLKVKSLRDMIGVVAQEPILFATTIAENIRWGREGVTDKEIDEAAKQANIYDFVMSLPKKFATLVGDEGGHMSGGQKQRIAIARAIVRNPKILLLDEATSSLDSHSESLVQAALDKVSQGRTTVVVAHRLSTIRDADKIIAMADGKLLEQGTHEELLKIEDGVYRNLINMQASREDEEPNTEANSLDFDLVNGDKISGEKEIEKLGKNLEACNNSDIHKIPVKTKENKQVENRAFPMLESVEGYQNVAMKSSDHSCKNIKEQVKENSEKVTSNKKLKSVKVEKGEEEEEEKEEKEEENLPEFDFFRILKMNSPECAYIIVGCIFAMIAGCPDPISGVLFAEMFKIFAFTNPEEQKDRASFIGLLYFAMGCVSLLSLSIEGIFFGKSGMEFTVRLRKMAFRSILRQDISYFDDHKNSTGSLCKRLAFDATRVQGCTGATLGVMMKNVAIICLAFGISFAFGWQMTLVFLAFFPLLALGGIIEFKALSGEDNKVETKYDEAGALATEAITNIRTVASLSKEQKIYNIYVDKISGSKRKSLKQSWVIGLAFGFSQCVTFFTMAATFAVATKLVQSGEMEFDKVFLVLMSIIFGALAVAQNSSFAPNVAEAKISSRRMMALLDHVPVIDAYSQEGETPSHCKGEISIKSVAFRYPLRPDIPVLKNLDIYIKPGQTVALVGQSGCGKSTTTKLIERFYDPDEGLLCLDGIDIRKLNVSWLRQQMGLVSQEPVLFDGSIKENILYGDCTRTASDEEIEEVAVRANIYKFIAEFPEGYATNAGSKGSKLSGGQKQRIAIARALLRNPKILLLDEATSALDTENEKIVQEALDAARAARTSIVIAHRLSTVKNADQIVVVDSGSVIEVGTHEELMMKQGAYYSLVNNQVF